MLYSSPNAEDKLSMSFLVWDNRPIDDGLTQVYIRYPEVTVKVIFRAELAQYFLQWGLEHDADLR